MGREKRIKAKCASALTKTDVLYKLLFDYYEIYYMTKRFLFLSKYPHFTLLLSYILRATI